MLHLFKKKRTATNEVQDRIAQSIVTKVIRLQQRWANAMQRQTAKLSTARQRIALTIFCLAAGSLSIYLIAAGLTGHRPASFSVSRIRMPAHSIPAGDEHTRSAALITRREYERISRYHRYIDSLARSPTGKPLCDSILSSHPGLLDSLSFIENIYQSQPKK